MFSTLVPLKLCHRSFYLTHSNPSTFHTPKKLFSDSLLALPEHSLSPSERTELNRAKLLDVSIESQKKTMDEYIRWIKDAKEGIHEIETKLLEAASARSRLEASITNLQDTKKRILISVWNDVFFL